MDLVISNRNGCTTTVPRPMTREEVRRANAKRKQRVEIIDTERYEDSPEQVAKRKPKVAKRDTRIFFTRHRLDGVRLYRVVDEPRYVTLFPPPGNEPVPWKECVAWRNEHTA